MKSLRVDCCGIPVLIKHGIKHTTNQAIANVLNYHFSLVFTHDEEATLPDMGPSPYPSLADIDIKIAEVTNLRKDFNPYKATGPDCIHAKTAERNSWKNLPKSNFDIYCLPAIRKDTTGLEEGHGNLHI